MSNQNELTWVELFPWISEIEGFSSYQAWSQPAINADPVDRFKMNRHIAMTAIRFRKDWTIGKLFPILPPELDLRSIEFPPRVKNTLGRQGLEIFGDLANYELRDLFDWINTGHRSVQDILEALATYCTSSRHFENIQSAIAHSQDPSKQGESLTSEQQQASLRVFAYKALAETLPGAQELVDDFVTLAKWKYALGFDGKALLEDSHLLGSSGSEAAQALGRLRRMTARELASASQIGAKSIAEMLDESLKEFDEREIWILQNRLFSNAATDRSKKPTLDQLGKELGVTRERIRQIQDKVLTKLQHDIETGELGAASQAVRMCIGDITPLEDLLCEIPALSENVPTVDLPAWFVLDRIDDEYEIEDGWCAVPTIQAAQESTKTQIEDVSNKYGVIELDQVLSLVHTQPEYSIDHVSDWLSYCGFEVRGSVAFTRLKSLQDYAASILSQKGTPLTAEQILADIPNRDNLRSLRNQLASDHRFVRSGKDTWALKEWGTGSYQSIRAAIAEELEQNGGSAELSLVVAKISEKFAVRPQSVYQYSAEPPFETHNGRVRRATGTRTIDKDPQETPRVFRWHSAWVRRVTITTDHLRGSGSVAPIAFARIWNIVPGQTKSLHTRLGDQSVYWTGLQPSFGTIRKFLEDDKTPLGTDVFLVCNDDDTFDVKRATTPNGDPFHDALALIGADQQTPSDQVLSELAAAVCLPKTADSDEIWFAYRDRGDDDIASLINEIERR